MCRTACTEPQCLYKGDLYLYPYLRTFAGSLWLNVPLNRAFPCSYEYRWVVTLLVFDHFCRIYSRALLVDETVQRRQWHDGEYDTVRHMEGSGRGQTLCEFSFLKRRKNRTRRGSVRISGLQTKILTQNLTNKIVGIAQSV